MSGKIPVTLSKNKRLAYFPTSRAGGKPVTVKDGKLFVVFNNQKYRIVGDTAYRQPTS